MQIGTGVGRDFAGIPGPRQQARSGRQGEDEVYFEQCFYVAWEVFAGQRGILRRSQYRQHDAVRGFEYLEHTVIPTRYQVRARCLD